MKRSSPHQSTGSGLPSRSEQKRIIQEYQFQSMSESDTNYLVEWQWWKSFLEYTHWFEHGFVDAVEDAPADEQDGSSSRRNGNTKRKRVKAIAVDVSIPGPIDNHSLVRFSVQRKRERAISMASEMTDYPTGPDSSPLSPLPTIREGLPAIVVDTSKGNSFLLPPSGSGMMRGLPSDLPPALSPSANNDSSGGGRRRSARIRSRQASPTSSVASMDVEQDGVREENSRDNIEEKEEESDGGGDDDGGSVDTVVSFPMEDEEEQNLVLLKPELLQKFHFELVAEGAWNKLVEWYGGGPAIPRKVIKIRSAISGKEYLEVEVNPLELLIFRCGSDGMVDKGSQVTLVCCIYIFIYIYIYCCCCCCCCLL